MDYLSADDYINYGIPATTPLSLISNASVLLDAHCRRQTLGLAQYTERVDVSGSRRVRLTYLPMAAATGAASAIVSARGRYTGESRRPELLLGRELTVFQLPGSWVSIDVSELDWYGPTGEILLTVNPLALPFDQLEITYTAGMETISEAVKQACAMVVRNALATPALNVRATAVDRMHMEYFADTLLDSNVRQLLAPYVAQRVG
jgi:hypothetical protein